MLQQNNSVKRALWKLKRLTGNYFGQCVEVLINFYDYHDPKYSRNQQRQPHEFYRQQLVEFLKVAPVLASSGTEVQDILNQLGNAGLINKRFISGNDGQSGGANAVVFQIIDEEEFRERFFGCGIRDIIEYAKEIGKSPIYSYLQELDQSEQYRQLKVNSKLIGKYENKDMQQGVEKSSCL